MSSDPAPSSVTDEELMTRVAAGEKAAFEELLERYEKRILNFARQVGRGRQHCSRHRSADVSQPLPGSGTLSADGPVLVLSLPNCPESLSRRGLPDSVARSE